MKLPVWPKSFPSKLQPVFAYIGAAGLILAASTYLLAQVPAMSREAEATCKTIRLCSPERPTDIQAVRTGWMGGGHDFRSVSGGQLSAYRAKYPDWNIEPFSIEERHHKDWKGHVTYMYVVGFNVTPKWTGPL